jgi:L-arabinose 1-dehydrogenase [NAD(P)+]
MARVAVTGAAGNIGRVTIDALAEDHEVTPITHREREGIDSIVLEIEDRDAVEEALAGQDQVIHLAGNPSPKADWESVLHVNIDGTQSIYQGAIANDLDRVAFASTNHVQHMINASDEDDPGGTVENPKTVSHDDQFRPDSYYGVSKMAGEGLGSYYADRHGIEVIQMRIGWTLDEEDLIDFQEKAPQQARHARAMYWSERDVRHGMRRVVEADIPENPLTVNLLSRNSDRYFTITHAMRTLDYAPKDDSSEVVERHS